MRENNILRTVTRDAFGSYGATAKGSTATDLGVYSPCVPLATTFLLQSYLSSTDYEKGILRQNPNELIVSSTLDSPDIIGYGLGLHPSSETPIAVRLKGTKANGPGASSVIILKPGEILRPSDGPFSGFDWGLPFGWLGGGTANLIVFVTPETYVRWNNDQREVLFHRLRLPIIQPASVPAVASARINWPLRFPWPNAFSVNTNQPQIGNPAISVNPSRVMIVVRVSADIASAPTIRFLMNAVDDFAISSTGTVDTTFQVYFDAIVGTQTAPVGLAGQTTNYPVLEYNYGPLLRGGNICRVTPVDYVAASLTGIELDIFRYGRL
jgi:hypothetical protein